MQRTPAESPRNNLCQCSPRVCLAITSPKNLLSSVLHCQRLSHIAGHVRAASCMHELTLDLRGKCSAESIGIHLWVSMALLLSTRYSRMRSMTGGEPCGCTRRVLSVQSSAKPLS